ncbi:GntP family permease [Flavihumibacter stibioxidans]|uniref:Gluconate transporter n=1 Tax=Flavihumibacter stibioxidans TaxID=1834163 RepID=A0ABR7M6T8_9BACT|nr:GntP family permease [Flavihumibacter stibioxidans]MBC6490729.1 hypothetical protein [Flavihumibacter stibioxidans]
MTGIALLLVILASLLFIIIGCAVLKWHPMIVLLVAGAACGLITGMPVRKTLDTLLSGAGAVFSSIGFLIVFGTLLGETLEKSGAAQALANIAVKKLHKRYLLQATGIIGMLVGIPVFCDAGFIILTRLVSNMSAEAALAPGSMQLALASGLYSSHVLVPPTPGPMAAAGNLGLAEHLGWVILFGLIAVIPALFIAWWMVGKYKGEILTGEPATRPEPTAKGTINIWRAIIPLLLPLLLITAGGHPVFALFISSMLALLLTAIKRRAEWTGWINQSLVQSGPIILITTAGGAFGAILKATSLQQMMEEFVRDQQISTLIIFPFSFALAALLKSAQGSSTAALIISSSMLFPLLGPFHLDPPQTALVLLSIGGGAMTVSHANDSYFWVIHQYARIPVHDLFRYYSITTGLMGLTVLLSSMLLYLVV